LRGLLDINIFKYIIMKKFIAILIGAVLTVTSITLTSSCQKDINNANSLVNTTWVCSTAAVTYNLTFTSASTFKMDMTAVGREFPTYTGVFLIAGNQDSLSGSIITLTPEKKWWEDDDTKDTWVGEFKSDTKVVIESFVFELKK
jgi:hypothetical protein